MSIKINELVLGQKKLWLLAKIKSISEDRRIPTTGDRALDVTISDGADEAVLTLFNEKMSLVRGKEGKEIRIKDAWVKKEYAGIKYLTIGLYGEIEVID